MYLYLLNDLNDDVLLLQVLVVGEDGVLLGLDHNVLKADAVDRHLRESVELHSTASVVADNVLDVDVTENGSLLGDGNLRGVVRIVTIGKHLSYRLATIIHIEGDGIGLDVGHCHVVDIDILDDTTTATGRLEAQADISAQELAVLDEDILHTTTHLRAYHKATMSGEYGTAIDYDILAGDATTATVGVLTTLDADAIIAGIELRIDNQCVLTRLEVEGIAILCIGRIAGKDIVENDVLAHQGMDVPSG